MNSTPQPERRLGWPRRIGRGVLAVVAALWLVLEEWVWDRLVALTRQLAKLPPFRGLEARIRHLGPKAAMAVFVVPWLLMLPVKVLGLWLFGTGRFGLGVVVFVVGKLLGTALLARLFTLTRPALLQIGWFRRFYEWFVRLRDRVYAYVRSLRTYQAVRRWLSAVRTRARYLWRRLRGQRG